MQHQYSSRIRGIGRGGASPVGRGRDPYRRHAVVMSMVFVFTLPGVLGFIVAFQPETGRAGAWTATSDGGGVGADERMVIGQQVYARACALCHGPNGEGVARLGKPLRNSGFVREHTDAELFAVIANGRMPGDPLNTTGALMPARGAQGLSDGQIREVIAYLHTMQDPSAPAASLDAWMPGGTGGTGGGAGVDLASLKGYGSYTASCSACHGQNAEGMEGLGLPLSTSGFVLGASDKDLVNFIKTGRPIWDENNSTGLDMPPKGGNPAITDGDLEEIVAFLRAAQKASVGG